MAFKYNHLFSLSFCFIVAISVLVRESFGADQSTRLTTSWTYRLSDREIPNANRPITLPSRFRPESIANKLGYYFESDTYECPVWVKLSIKLLPWFDSCKTKLERALQTENLQLTGTVSCTFYLDSNGTVVDLFTWMRSSARDAELISNLIRASSPFNAPPIELLEKRRILITITRDGQIRLELDLTARPQADSVFQEAKTGRRGFFIH